MAIKSKTKIKQKHKKKEKKRKTFDMTHEEKLLVDLITYTIIAASLNILRGKRSLTLLHN